MEWMMSKNVPHRLVIRSLQLITLRRPYYSPERVYSYMLGASLPCFIPYLLNRVTYLTKPKLNYCFFLSTNSTSEKMTPPTREKQELVLQLFQIGLDSVN